MTTTPPWRSAPAPTKRNQHGPPLHIIGCRRGATFFSRRSGLFRPVHRALFLGAASAGNSARCPALGSGRVRDPRGRSGRRRATRPCPADRRGSASPKCMQESLGRDPGHRPPGVSLRPLGMIQPTSISMSSVPLLITHAADVLDLGARHRLVIGHDGQGFDRRRGTACAAPSARASGAGPDRARCGSSSRPRRARD